VTREPAAEAVNPRSAAGDPFQPESDFPSSDQISDLLCVAKTESGRGSADGLNVAGVFAVVSESESDGALE
jgi:hypothetical protein